MGDCLPCLDTSDPQLFALHQLYRQHKLPLQHRICQGSGHHVHQITAEFFLGSSGHTNSRRTAIYEGAGKSNSRFSESPKLGKCLAFLLQLGIDIFSLRQISQRDSWGKRERSNPQHLFEFLNAHNSGLLIPKRVPRELVSGRIYSRVNCSNCCQVRIQHFHPL